MPFTHLAMHIQNTWKKFALGPIFHVPLISHRLESEIPKACRNLMTSDKSAKVHWGRVQQSEGLT